jgi:hypothetical protein
MKTVRDSLECGVELAVPRVNHRGAVHVNRRAGLGCDGLDRTPSTH